MKIVLSLLLLAAAPPVSAFHPLISEDTGFLGKDGRQVELGYEHAVSREGADIYSNSGAAEISYGLFDKVDILLSAPWQGWNSRGISESGIGDVALEAKFAAGSRYGWELALKPGFSLPAGDEAKGLGAGKGGVWFYGVAGRQSGAWQYYLNAGYLFNRNSLDEDDHILKASAAAAYGFAEGWLASLDLAAEGNPDPDSSTPPVSAVLGLIWSPHRNLDLDAGFRLGLDGPADDHALLLGLTLRL